jgi:hypothetical protein
MKINLLRPIAGFALFVLLSNCIASTETSRDSLWELAQANKNTLRFSTLFSAQDVRRYLSSEEGLENAIRWCKDTAVTKVFIESYRDGYRAQREALENARERFRKAGIEPSGCITPTRVGKKSVNGWEGICCYTDIPTQEKLQSEFEYAAGLFDEIMIDDFLFTDCQCEECIKARGDRSWTDYRCDLMVNLSRNRILAPARKVNPDVKIIIKYPQWYDRFHERGYEVVRETNDFDLIWVGTETRDPDNTRWGREAQYKAYFIMQWLGKIGGKKTGGGWFDPYGTSPPTYVEQARQTILAQAKNALLFCYGSLQRGQAAGNVEVLRKEIPALFRLAQLVQGKPIIGVHAPKPPNSPPRKEQYIFDFVGMLGLPLVPSAMVDPEAQAAFFSQHALADPKFTEKLGKLLSDGKPVLVTGNLFKDLYQSKGEKPDASQSLQVIHFDSDPRNLYNMSQPQLDDLRKPLLAPFGIEFSAPSRVALYLFGSSLVVIENFNDSPAEIVFKKKGVQILSVIPLSPMDEGVKAEFKEGVFRAALAPRSLVAIISENERP